jgi:hypothetical protein
MLRSAIVLAAVLMCAHVPVLAQEQTPAPAEAPYEFVSGTVVEQGAGRLVVNRAVPGKPPENLTFRMTSETKVEGKLRVHARVTVGFKTSEEGEAIALRVIVREGGKR